MLSLWIASFFKKTKNKKAWKLHVSKAQTGKL